jgi:hypothetical protein
MSGEYINRKTFLEDVKIIEKQLEEFGLEFTKEDVLRHLETTRRVVEIVRCKDCVHRGTNICFMEHRGAEWTSDYGFCHIGREKTE